MHCRAAGLAGSGEGSAKNAIVGDQHGKTDLPENFSAGSERMERNRDGTTPPQVSQISLVSQASTKETNSSEGTIMRVMCHVKPSPCSLVDAVAGSSKIPAGRLRQLLPCGSCHGGESNILTLSGLRLGSHERRILLAAALPDHKHRVVPPQHPGGRSAQEAHRRAQRKLARSGLLSLSKVNTGNGSFRRSTGIRLTPLGQAIVARVGDTLAAGTPIRWQKYQPALISDLRRPFEELLASFQESIKSYHSMIENHQETT